MMTNILALSLASGAPADLDADRLAALEELVRRQGQQIAVLERELRDREAAPVVAPAPQPSLAESSPPAGKPADDPRLALSGDLRLRQEFNWGSNGNADRTRNALRARLAARFALTDRITLGTRVVTGDPDDPNSADVTISDFADDFDVSLDQVFVSAALGNVTLVGGKFPNPFVRTDLVWDSDVNPQGLSAVYQTELAPGARIGARVLYFAIDENVGGKGSSMVGGQLAISLLPQESWSFDLAAGYYDYELGSLIGADAGDIRSNRVDPLGSYLSDYDLIEALGTVTFRGLGADWPVRGTFDYVRNLGATDHQDTGYLAEVGVGSVGHSGAWQFWYQHASAETDAVFAAFSQDNIPLGTNYILHAAGVTYSISSATRLEGLVYHFRTKSASLNEFSELDWQDRARINLVIDF